LQRRAAVRSRLAHAAAARGGGRDGTHDARGRAPVRLAVAQTGVCPTGPPRVAPPAWLHPP